MIRQFPLVKTALLWYRTVRARPSLSRRVFLLADFLRDLKRYNIINSNKKFKLTSEDLKPCIFDKTESTPVDSVYFYQNSWCAKKIFDQKPARHYDVGSDTKMVGIISQFTPTTMVDIRPVGLSMPGFSFQEGDILHLPFKDSSLSSVSSICVLEHIGLGRYGDPLDAYGSEKAVQELKRVLAKNGDMYISIPVDDDNRIYFNAHRSFTREYILELFKPLGLVEEKYIYRKDLVDKYNPARGFGTGLFHFRNI